MRRLRFLLSLEQVLRRSMEPVERLERLPGMLAPKEDVARLEGSISFIDIKRTVHRHPCLRHPGLAGQPSTSVRLIFKHIVGKGENNRFSKGCREQAPEQSFCSTPRRHALRRREKSYTLACQLNSNLFK